MKASRFLLAAAFVLAPMAAFAQAPIVVDNWDTNANVQGGAPVGWSRITNATSTAYISTNPPSLGAPFTSPNALYFEDFGDAATQLYRADPGSGTNLYRLSYNVWVPNYWSNSHQLIAQTVGGWYRSRVQVFSLASSTPLSFQYVTNQTDTGGGAVTEVLPISWLATNAWNTISWGNDLPGGGWIVKINNNTTNFVTPFTPNVSVRTVNMFGGSGGEAYHGYGWIDNVSLIGVPEPGTAALALSAAGLLFLLRRRV
ncbi:MAG: hypothetical protein IT578_00010 [Verrucomicrobiae bacterium]|nr:hypothetical protein [Verrucomicrobiae bacterium]